MAHEATATPLRTHASPSRRALLGAAAWSVPAITLATAAPAFATSGEAPVAGTKLAAVSPAATITTTSTGARKITGSVVIKNPTTTATTGLQAIFSMPSSYLPSGTPAMTLSSTIGNWTLTGFANSGSILTVTLNAPRQLAAQSSTTISFSVTAQMPNLPTTAPAVSVRSAASNMPGAPAWVSFLPG
ncbi:hypothetical protein [Nocardioides gilvus]|uniref:hypothetical protein n=1 Tax=Nocardioides gilvus TaxID=1735589 RepID=UPI000D7452C4|nr:hypothetical protein [Nocardioides gilvus]